jgi:hypothetical protein
MGDDHASSHLHLQLASYYNPRTASEGPHNTKCGPTSARLVARMRVQGWTWLSCVDMCLSVCMQTAPDLGSLPETTAEKALGTLLVFYKWVTRESYSGTRKSGSSLNFMNQSISSGKRTRCRVKTAHIPWTQAVAHICRPVNGDTTAGPTSWVDKGQTGLDCKGAYTETELSKCRGSQVMLSRPRKEQALCTDGHTGPPGGTRPPLEGAGLSNNAMCGWVQGGGVL